MRRLCTLQRKVSLDLQRDAKGKGVPLHPLDVPVRLGLFAWYALVRVDGVTDVTSGTQANACFAGTSPVPPEKVSCLFSDQCHQRDSHFCIPSE